MKALILLLLVSALAGCGQQEPPKQNAFAVRPEIAVQKPPEKAEQRPAEIAEPQKPVWSEEVARGEAGRILSLVGRAETDLKSALETGDSAGFVRYVTRPLSVEIQRWHEHDHPHRFAACHDAAIALHGYAMTMYTEYLSGGPFDGVMVRRERKAESGRLKQGKTDCAKALKAN